MGPTSGFTDFNPASDIPSLQGKVILITGGTAGLGKTTIEALASHSPSHIYFTGRNAQAGDALIAEIKKQNPSVSLTFIPLDLNSLANVQSALSSLNLPRLDVLILNAGIMATPPGLSADGFEIQFATNHLGHAMVVKKLLPVMLRTVKMGNGSGGAADVRIVVLTSTAWSQHPKSGIKFKELRTKMDSMGGNWVRYGQSKLANLIYARELACRFPSIVSVSVHPGTTETGLVTNLPAVTRWLLYGTMWLMRIPLVSPEQGCYSQVWCAAGAQRSELVNGGYYMPVGVFSNDKLNETAKSEKLGKELWDWTEKVLEKFEY